MDEWKSLRVGDYSFYTYAWVIGLSMWGGLVSFLSKVRAGKVRAFNIIELIGELAISAFVGILTFWLAEAAGFPEILTAATVGISSHMGTRGMYKLEQFLVRKLGLDDPPEAKP